MAELEGYDAIIVGTGTRYGRMASQMAAFLDQTSALWMRGTFNGKVDAAFTSTATQHGGQETTLFSIITNLLHFGMIIVGLPYSYRGQISVSEIVGGAPYGATTVVGGDGSRQPTEIDLSGARHQGELVAKTAAKLFGSAAGNAITIHHACVTRSSIALEFNPHRPLASLRVQSFQRVKGARKKQKK